MAAKLEPLPPQQLKNEGALIPFSDYSKWERRPIKRHVVSAPKIRSRASKEGLVHWSTSIGVPASLQNDLSRNEKTKVIPSGSSALKTKLISRYQEPTKIKLLKNEVILKRNSLEVYHAYIKDLFDDNVSMITAIVEIEEKTHSSTDKILDRYKHFKGAMHTLRLKAKEMLTEALENLEKIRHKLHEKTELHRRSVIKLDETIECSNRDLQILKHYKEKEYLVRQMRIEQLKENQQDMHDSQEEELEELKLQILEEKEDHEHHMKALKAELEAKATEVCLASLHEHVQIKALQNRIMEREVLMHKMTRDELMEAIVDLRSAVISMKQEAVAYGKIKNKTTPYRCRRNTKCLPDTEIILNIPLQEELPV